MLGKEGVTGFGPALLAFTDARARIAEGDAGMAEFRVVVREVLARELGKCRLAAAGGARFEVYLEFRW